MNKLDSVTFDDFLRDVKPFENNADCNFDLSGIHLITPSALVQLAAACYGLARDGLQATVILDDVDVKEVLHLDSARQLCR